MTTSQRKLLNDVRALQTKLKKHEFDGETLDVMLASARRNRNADPRDRHARVVHMALSGLVNQLAHGGI